MRDSVRMGIVGARGGALRTIQENIMESDHTRLDTKGDIEANAGQKKNLLSTRRAFELPSTRSLNNWA